MSETTQIRGKVKSITLDAITTIKADSERRISGYASKPVRDRVGDIVETAAFFDTMPKFMEMNPMMLYMHNPTAPIGKWDKYELRQDGLWMSGFLADNVAKADEAWQLSRQGILRALSIGFREIDAGMEEDGNYHIRRLDLLEVSPVAIPANQEALFTVGDGGKLLDIELLPEKEKMELTFDGLFAALQQAGLSSLVDSVKDLKDEIASLRTTTQELETLKNEMETLKQSITTYPHRLADVEKCLVKLVKWEANRLSKGVASNNPGH